MRLGVDASPIDDGPSGTRTRLEGLLPALLAADPGLEIVLWLGRDAIRPVAPAGPRVTQVRTPSGPGRWATRLLRSGQTARRAARDRLDALLVDYDPVLASPPTAVTVHDLRSLLGLGPLWRRLAFGPRMARNVRRAALVVAPSRTVADEVAARWGVAADRLAVVPNAPGPAFVPGGPRETRDGPYVLHVGPDEPRKNLDVLRLSPVPVLLVGRARRREPPFVPLGMVPEERLARLVTTSEIRDQSIGFRRDFRYRDLIESSGTLATQQY